MHREHSEYDMIQLTPKGHSVAEAMEHGEPGTGTAADDILAYLEEAPKETASCGELGMNLKITGEELKEALEKLEAGCYINHLPARPRHYGAGFGSYRGGMAPHEYLGQEVEEHAIAEPQESIRRNLDDNYVEEEE